MPGSGGAADASISPVQNDGGGLSTHTHTSARHHAIFIAKPLQRLSVDYTDSDDEF